MIEILAALATISGTTIAVYYHKIRPWRIDRKKRKVFGSTKGEKQSAVEKLGLEKFENDTELEYKKGQSSNREGAFFVSDGMTQNDIQEELDKSYVNEKLITSGRFIFPTDGWRTTIKDYLAMRMCEQQDGREGRANALRRDLEGSHYKKFEVIKEIDQKDRLEDVLAEARSRIKRNGPIDANQEEFIFLLDYWKDYDLETYTIHHDDISAYVSDVDSSNKDAALLSRGSHTSTSNEIEDDLRDKGFRKKDEKKTNWEKLDSKDPIEGICKILVR